MKKKCSLGIGALIVVLLAATILGGCTNTQQDTGNKQKVTDKQVTIGYVQWSSAEASTYLVQEVLDRVGYDVKKMTLQAGAMYEGLANGDLDTMVCAWLPKTHKSYWEEYSENLVELGVNYEGARIGLVVPEYVDVDSISELKENPDKFNKQIIGIDPGAGVMQITKNQTIDKYGLQDWDLVESSGPAMTAKLKESIQKEEPVVVTGWTPHWKWSAFDLKFLDDSKGVYGEPDDIKTLGRTGIKQDLPVASKILENYKLSTKQLGGLINMIQNGMEPGQAAEKYVDQNLDLVNSWLPEGHKIKQK